MKSIGDKLKQRRLEVGYTIDDLHDKTKLSILHINAIESGNLEYFKHDISYLKFFLQYYCQAVYLDYAEIDDEFQEVLKEFDETQLLKIKESHQTSHENIQRRIQKNLELNKPPQTPTTKKFIRVDQQTLIIIGIVVVLLLTLLIGFFKIVLPHVKDRQEPENVEILPDDFDNQENDKDTVVDEPEPNPEPDLESESEVSEIKITEIDQYNYEINLDSHEESTLVVEFSGDTWIQVYVNGVSVVDPMPGIYGPNTSVKIPINDSINSVMIHFGNLLGSKIFINEQEIILNETVIDVTAPQIYFHFKGE